MPNPQKCIIIGDHNPHKHSIIGDYGKKYIPLLALSSDAGERLCASEFKSLFFL